MKEFQNRCSVCGIEILDFAKALISGCPSCGNRKFTSVAVEKEKKVENPLISEHIAVRVTSRGSYAINLKQLLNREQNEPIAFQDSNGTVRLVLNPD